MAVLFPDKSKTRIVFSSHAEEQFYTAAAAQLGPEWRLYHSVTLSNFEDGLKDNEMDFILYHPQLGLIVVEVKGGRIEVDPTAATFYSINRRGDKFAIRNPFQQVLAFKSRLIRHLKEQDIRVPISHAVCFPTVNETDIPAGNGIQPEVVIGHHRLKHLADALTQLVKKSQPERFLKFFDAHQALDKLLIGRPFSTKLRLKAYTEAHEQRVGDTQVIFGALLGPLMASKRLGIEGEAGTGKTVLATTLARREASAGKKVLLLTSNPLLAAKIQEQVGTAIKVDTYLDFSKRYGISLLAPAEGFKGERSHWMEVEAPRRLLAKITQQTSRYDVLICDEAQDVQPTWWKPLEAVLTSADSQLYVFFDRSQGVFGNMPDDHFVPENVLPVPAPYLPLVNNYRTTREIVSFARSFRTGKQILTSQSERLGFLPEIVVYKDKADFERLIGELCKKLVREEQMAPQDITILSARAVAAENSMLKGMSQVGGIAMTQLHRNRKKTTTPDGIHVSTVASFKGLETKVGILVNVSEYNLPLSHPIMSSLTYVACTRAKHLLYVFVKEGDEKLRIMREAQQSVALNGVVVLEASDTDVTMTGVVSYYDPLRLGIIQLDSQHEQRGAIVVAPHDVKSARLGQLNVGQKVRFRSRSEGSLVLAVDLEIVVDENSKARAEVLVS